MSIKIQSKLNGLAVVSLFGAAISLYQTHHFYSLRQGMAGFSNLCRFGSFDCNAVEMSPYAELVWGFPLSGLAIAWFFSVFILALLAKNPIDRMPKLHFLRIFSLVGVITSVVYFVIMAVKIKTYCSMCMLVDASVFTIAILSFTMKPEKPFSEVNRKFIQSVAMIFGGSLLGSILIAAMLGSSPVSQSDIDREVANILNKPTVEVSVPEYSPTMGDANAPVTIVKFSDFQCPACLRGAHSIHPLFSKYKGRLRFVFRNFPLDPKCNRLVNHSMHPSACVAAKAALCLQEEGKFQQAYEKLFENQDSLTPKVVLDIAKSVSSHPEKIAQCIESEQTAKNIYRDVDEGEKLDIMSTPTFFINGKRVEGALPTKAWIQLFEKLSKVSTASH